MAVTNQTTANLLDFLTASMFICGTVVVLILKYVQAPYGRHTVSAVSRTVPIFETKVNPRFAWLFQEMFSFFIPVILHLTLLLNPHTKYQKYQASTIVIGFFIMHYFYRSFIYPYMMTSSTKYPVTTMLLAAVFTTVNGYMQVTSVHLYPHDISWLSQPRFIIGSIIFCFGFMVLVHADYTLITLRKPGETGYKIPRGGMFEYVSAANYFGEIVEWFGYAILSWNWQSLVFFLFVISNIGPRAFHNHRWYLEKFENYPKNRRALIPFIL